MNEETEVIAIILIILGIVLAIFTCGTSLLLTLVGIILLFVGIADHSTKEIHIYHERPPRDYYDHGPGPPPGYYDDDYRRGGYDRRPPPGYDRRPPSGYHDDRYSRPPGDPPYEEGRQPPKRPPSDRSRY